MKKYNVSVKIISKNDFEIMANNEEKAIDKIEEFVLNKNHLLIDDDKEYEFVAVEIEESDCKNCESYCLECGTCFYEEDGD